MRHACKPPAVRLSGCVVCILGAGKAPVHPMRHAIRKENMPIGHGESCSLPALNSQHRFQGPLVPATVEVQDILRTLCSWAMSVEEFGPFRVSQGSAERGRHMGWLGGTRLCCAEAPVSSAKRSEESTRASFAKSDSTWSNRGAQMQSLVASPWADQ